MSEEELPDYQKERIQDAEYDARVAIAYYRQLVKAGLSIDIAIKVLVAWIRADYTE